jgi:hypothetical protein
MTQILARTTTILDGRKKVKMTGRVYLRAIVPIGIMFSLSLICGNMTYLYLSVAFIQMLKATTPVAVLLATWGMGMAPANMKVLANVSIIVIGVVIASFGEIKFNMVGFLFQIGGIVFEATRLVMVQGLLSSADFKMDPMVSLYYFAPICAVMNGAVALFLEIPHVTMDHVYSVGIWLLVLNAVVAFLLNVSVVFLVSDTSGFWISIPREALLTLSIDWQDLIPGHDSVRCPQGYPVGRCLHAPVADSRHWPSVLRLLHCSDGSCLVQAWR